MVELWTSVVKAETQWKGQRVTISDGWMF